MNLVSTRCRKPLGNAQCGSSQRTTKRHASAWNIDYEKEVHLKMCIQVNEEDFTAVHHELGHNFLSKGDKKKCRDFLGRGIFYSDNINAN